MVSGSNLAEGSGAVGRLLSFILYVFDRNSGMVEKPVQNVVITGHDAIPKRCFAGEYPFAGPGQFLQVISDGIGQGFQGERNVFPVKVVGQHPYIAVNNVLTAGSGIIGRTQKFGFIEITWKNISFPDLLFGLEEKDNERSLFFPGPFNGLIYGSEGVVNSVEE